MGDEHRYRIRRHLQTVNVEIAIVSNRSVIKGDDVIALSLGGDELDTGGVDDARPIEGIFRSVRTLLAVFRQGDPLGLSGQIQIRRRDAPVLAVTLCASPVTEHIYFPIQLAEIPAQITHLNAHAIVEQRVA